MQPPSKWEYIYSYSDDISVIRSISYWIKHFLNLVDWLTFTLTVSHPFSFRSWWMNYVHLYNVITKSAVIKTKKIIKWRIIIRLFTVSVIMCSFRGKTRRETKQTIFLWNDESFAFCYQVVNNYVNSKTIQFPSIIFMSSLC